MLDPAAGIRLRSACAPHEGSWPGFAKEEPDGVVGVPGAGLLCPERADVRPSDRAELQMTEGPEEMLVEVVADVLLDVPGQRLHTLEPTLGVDLERDFMVLYG